MTEHALPRSKARVRRRRKKPDGVPPFEPWWFLAGCAVLVVFCFFRDVSQEDYLNAAIGGWFACWLADRSIRAYRWERWRGDR